MDKHAPSSLPPPTAKHTHTQKPLQHAILVATPNHTQSQESSEAHIKELAQLAHTLGLKDVAHIRQRLFRPHPGTLIGKGKIEEITACLQAHQEAVLIFDDNLSPRQLRNLERALHTHIYDRSLLILEIFLLRAHTAQARLQVNLARYEYLLPRLTRRWTHLERQRGGVGTRGGAGEKEIETDRRQIRNRITHLKKQLRQVEKQGLQQRKSRHHLRRIALVGYTNTGKSTLMRALTRAPVEAADKLFATVDTTVRRIQLGTHTCLLSDTVGFIRKLPHGLVESFKSTLAEAQEADLLLHVADISHPAFEQQIQVVTRTLEDIHAAHKPTLLVFNKADKVPSDEHPDALPAGQIRAQAIAAHKHYVAEHYGSAQHPQDVAALKQLLIKEIEKLRSTTQPHPAAAAHAHTHTRHNPP